MRMVSESKKVDAFRLLKSLKRGDEVWVDTNGHEEVMFVVREINIADAGEFGQLQLAAWEYANIHVSTGLGNRPSSITVQQQAKKDKELPFITRKVNDRKVRMVEIGPDLYKRIDELAGKSGPRQQLASSLKNMLAKRAKEVPEDILV